MLRVDNGRSGGALGPTRTRWANGSTDQLSARKTARAHTANGVDIEQVKFDRGSVRRYRTLAAHDQSSDAVGVNESRDDGSRSNDRDIKNSRKNGVSAWEWLVSDRQVFWLTLLWGWMIVFGVTTKVMGLQ